MTSIPTPSARFATPTLADRVLSRSAVNNAVLITAGTALVAILAQATVPLWPVPVTGQTLGVMLVGATLGAWRGAASLALYLALGLAGLPIFAGAGAGFSPSFGFIIGFVPAAALIGWLAERSWDRRPALAMLGFLAASIVPFLVGVPYLAVALGSLDLPNDVAAVMQAGVIPFLPGGIVKWLIAAAALPLLWKLVRAADERASAADAAR